MKYRRLTCADAELALGMNKTFREGFITPEGAEAFLRDRRNWLFAAVEGEQVLAFAYGYAMQRLDGAQMLYIHEVGVADAYQRRGLGMQLMKSLKAAC